MSKASGAPGTSTPRDYCTANRQPPFRNHPFAPGEPAWKKIGRGLLCVTDGTPRQYVGAGLMFTVELDEDGRPRIASYGCGTANSGLATTKPYTYESARTMVAMGKIELKKWITYEDMVVMVRRTFPMAWVPSQSDFLAEYGLTTAQFAGKEL